MTAEVPGKLFYFIPGFTNIMRLHLLTARLSSINPLPLEAETRSCWVSETLVCSLLLPHRLGKQREWNYRWKFDARLCLGAGKSVAGVPARKHTSWCCFYVCSPQLQLQRGARQGTDVLSLSSFSLQLPFWVYTFLA